MPLVSLLYYPIELYWSLKRLYQLDERIRPAVTISTDIWDKANIKLKSLKPKEYNLRQGRDWDRATLIKALNTILFCGAPYIQVGITGAGKLLLKKTGYEFSLFLFFVK